MPLTISQTLLWYKRPEVRSAMVAGAAHKEIGVRFEGSFGKRPDALEYEQEILSAVQRGATSFHASEEIWSEPLAIETGMSRQRADELRTGWDLILDIDFTNFEATKLIAKALCDALESHGVTQYGLKFSGNKGFHIGVAWESFPKEWDGKAMSSMFPEAPRAIADYLVWQIDNVDNGFSLSAKLRALLGAEESAKHLKRVCTLCGRDRVSKTRTVHFICTRCGNAETGTPDDEYKVCGKCSSVMERIDHAKDSDERCVCSGSQTQQVFDLKIDAELIASRHLYRLEYSLHEKSGLVSLPIAPATLLSFEREQANPAVIAGLESFWYRDVEGQGYGLLAASLARALEDVDESAAPREIIWEADAAPEAAFPPTIAKMLAGMTDGKKRGMFILANFFVSVGWNYDMIEERLLQWNQANPEQMRDGDIRNHLRYHKQKAQQVLPPNFANPIYKDLGVLVEDELTRRCKNPVQYVRMRMLQAGIDTSKKKVVADKNAAPTQKSDTNSE